MELEVLDTNFSRIAIADSYESMIWTDRYNQYGDFELYLGMERSLLDVYKPDYYLVSDDSEYAMIIENTKITTSTEEGNHFIVTGRSLESILARRIVWTQTNIYGNLQNGVKKLINENIINPSLAARKISNFVFEESDDPVVTAASFDELQFTGETVYDAITKMCDAFDLGFKVTLNSDNQFVFKLYAGKDRSYKQDSLPYVVFSPTFENIINSDYYEAKENYCNVTLVAGEGEGAARTTRVVGDNTSTELNRRELFTDARDLSSNVDGGTLTPAQYQAVLQTRGEEKLKEVEIIKEFEGQVEPTQMYRYGEHFFMGDITELENEYGLETRVRVMEYIHSDSDQGIEEYPTFKVLDTEQT